MTLGGPASLVTSCLTVAFTKVNPPLRQGLGLGDRRDFLSVVSAALTTPRPRDPGQPFPADDPDHVGEVGAAENVAFLRRHQGGPLTGCDAGSARGLPLAENTATLASARV